MSYVAGFLEQKGFAFDSAHGMNLPVFFHFLIRILQHQSLSVSISILHVWTKLLASEKTGNTDLVISLIPSLLEICTQRLIRWESLPEDIEEPTVMFLNEDIDTVPEKHVFVGNYRRYCSSIVESIAQKRPQEAIPHILSAVDVNLDNLYSGVAPFSGMSAFQYVGLLALTDICLVQTFQKTSIPLMRADTQFAVVEATLKGYSKWVISHGKTPQQDVCTAPSPKSSITKPMIRSKDGGTWRMLWKYGPLV